MPRFTVTKRIVICARDGSRRHLVERSGGRYRFVCMNCGSKSTVPARKYRLDRETMENLEWYAEVHMEHYDEERSLCGKVFDGYVIDNEEFVSCDTCKEEMEKLTPDIWRRWT